MGDDARAQDLEPGPYSFTETGALAARAVENKLIGMALVR